MKNLLKVKKNCVERELLYSFACVSIAVELLLHHEDLRQQQPKPMTNNTGEEKSKVSLVILLTRYVSVALVYPICQMFSIDKKKTTPITKCKIDLSQFNLLLIYSEH